MEDVVRALLFVVLVADESKSVVSIHVKGLLFLKMKQHFEKAVWD